MIYASNVKHSAYVSVLQDFYEACGASANDPNAQVHGHRGPFQTALMTMLESDWNRNRGTLVRSLDVTIMPDFCQWLCPS